MGFFWTQLTTPPTPTVTLLIGLQSVNGYSTKQIKLKIDSQQMRYVAMMGFVLRAFAVYIMNVVRAKGDTRD